MHRARHLLIAGLMCSVVLCAQNKNPSADAQGSAAGAPRSDSTTLEPISRAEPGYPLDAEKGKLQGQVVVKVLVSETGAVESAEVTSGNPVLARAATAAAREWKFKPFIKSGKPEKVSTRLSFDFIFRDKAADSNAQQTTANGPANTDSGQTMKIVWISQDLAAKLVLSAPHPRYPDLAKHGRIQGAVVLFAVIGTDGMVRQLNVLSGDPLLKQSATDAVRQWRFRPYILNGEPTEVQTSITVIFSLAG